MEKQLFTKFWIIIATAFLLVILFLAAWFISLEISATDLYETYNKQQLLLVTGAASGIEGLMDDLGTSLSTLAKREEIQYFVEIPSRRELAQKMLELSTQGLTDIGILDAGGTARYFAVDQGVEGINFAWRSYFKTTREVSSTESPGEPVVELQTIDQGDQGFTIAIPIFETTVSPTHPSPSGDFAGIIQGSLTLDTLTERYIVPFKPSGDGHIYLVNKEYDIIWSSDPAISRMNLLGVRQAALEELVNQMSGWSKETANGGAYTYSPPSRRDPVELVAFAPVRVGTETMAIFVKTPASVARQTSTSTFQGQQFVFILSLSTLLVGILLGGLVLRRESRRRFQAEAALRLSETAAAILEERNRLAGDLHDSVTQGLYGIVLHAGAAIGQLAAGQVDQVAAYLREIKETGKEGLAEMRLLIFELRPPVLEQEGLVASLEARLYAVEKRAGLEAEINSKIIDRLPFDVEEVLYRIAQEALNNVLKHAQAKHIQVSLVQDEDHISMEITDDGIGFDPSSTHGRGRIGLANMGERALKMGGELQIDSQPGEGTRIYTEVKL
jgi:signal transduction histidine kinase